MIIGKERQFGAARRALRSLRATAAAADQSFVISGRDDQCHHVIGIDIGKIVQLKLSSDTKR